MEVSSVAAYLSACNWVFLLAAFGGLPCLASRLRRLLSFPPVVFPRRRRLLGDPLEKKLPTLPVAPVIAGVRPVLAFLWREVLETGVLHSMKTFPKSWSSSLLNSQAVARVTLSVGSKAPLQKGPIRSVAGSLCPSLSVEACGLSLSSTCSSSSEALLWPLKCDFSLAAAVPSLRGAPEGAWSLSVCVSFLPSCFNSSHNCVEGLPEHQKRLLGVSSTIHLVLVGELDLES